MKNVVNIPSIRIHQPIGDFYIGSIDSRDLISISSVDMRRISSDLDRYIGIQRRLSADRVTEIGKFVNSVDATFPTSVVLSVRRECAEFDETLGTLKLFEATDDETGELITSENIATILDGQHRVEGLKAFNGEKFDVPVSVFINADLADQAYIFATVNLAQTKVNRSLVYDLLDYAKARSPQKSAHDITIALDKYEKSPFSRSIKRLGTATPGREGETLAQATVVNALIPFISRDPEQDRYDLARGKSVSEYAFTYAQTPFRSLWVRNRDIDITRILLEYFSAVQSRWPAAWSNRGKGSVLPRTNGFRALMRLLRHLYLQERRTLDLERPVIPESVYARYLQKINLDDSQLNSDTFKPGSSGESSLYRHFMQAVSPSLELDL